ncbi:MAG: proline dehydrogenase family protein [Balneolaceae bacterium]
MKLPYFLARRFVAGEHFEQALPRVRQINEMGILTSLVLLGEEVKERSVAEETVENYKELLKEMDAHSLRGSISIKLTMTGLSIDEELCRKHLHSILDTASKLGRFVRIDMESSRYTEATLRLFREAHDTWNGHVGIVIQAALHRTERDIIELADMGADVRLCKGAYKEPADIALRKMPEIREAFKRYGKILLERTPLTRFATHDDELVTWLRDYASESDIPKDRFEFQMLYGLREETMVQLAADGYRARIYVPYGTMWFPYFRRRLLERKENVFFLLANLFKK